MDISSLAKLTMVGAVPHMGTPNLKVFCQIPTGAYTTDSVGNKKPILEQSIVLVSVKEDFRPNNTFVEGGQVKSINLIGRLISPLLLSPGINIKQRYKAELTDFASGVIHQGEFEFSLSVQNRIKTYSQLRGNSIKGLFVEVK